MITNLTSASITKLGQVFILKEIRTNNYPMEIINSVHDESGTISKIEFIDSEKVVKDCMENAGKVFIKQIFLKCETAKNKTWTK